MGNYLLSVESPPEATANAITATLRQSTGLAWWHYLQNAWIIKDNQDRGTAYWFERLMGPEPAHQCIIVEIVDSSWMVYADKRAHGWLQKNL